jgi:hypothetical protein
VAGVSVVAQTHEWDSCFAQSFDGNRRSVRLTLTYVAWWIGLFWLWFAYQGTWNRIQWVAAAGMATVGAALATAIAARGAFRYRIPLSSIAAAKRVPLQIVIDFGIITLVLARRLAGRDVRGTFVVRTFEPTGRGRARAGDVAWRTITAMFSPNALPIDVDPEAGVSYFHDLVVNRSSEEPA